MIVASAHDEQARTRARRPEARGITPSRPAAFVALLALAALVLASTGARAAGATKDPFSPRESASPTPTAVIASTVVEPVWPRPSELPALTSIGEGKAIVFSPDFSVPTNRLFYERLGFFYLEDASWENVLDEIEAHNAGDPEHAIDTVFVTSHGANGNGRKLQAGHEPDAPRSYVSIGALQERLGRAGVRRVVLAACNTGRLFRPQIYNRLDRTVRDPLFLPPTLGIVDASDDFDASGSDVTVIRRADNQKENTSEGTVAELSPAARHALGFDDVSTARSIRFVVSDLLVQMLTADPQLRLTSRGYVSNIVLEGADNERSDRFYAQFVRVLDAVAGRRPDADPPRSAVIPGVF